MLCCVHDLHSARHRRQWYFLRLHCPISGVASAILVQRRARGFGGHLLHLLPRRNRLDETEWPSLSTSTGGLHASEGSNISLHSQIDASPDGQRSCSSCRTPFPGRAPTRDNCRWTGPDGLLRMVRGGPNVPFGIPSGASDRWRLRILPQTKCRFHLYTVGRHRCGAALRSLRQRSTAVNNLQAERRQLAPRVPSTLALVPDPVDLPRRTRHFRCLSPLPLALHGSRICRVPHHV